MPDSKITALAEATALAATDLIPVVADVATTPVTKKMTRANLDTQVSKDITRHLRGTISQPNGYYTNVRPQVPVGYTDAAVTITSIRISGPDSTPTSEAAFDLKHADDVFTGSFANAAVIDVCDTTNGAFYATNGFDDATVPANKWIYFSFDAAPHTDWKDIAFDITYTYD